MTALQMAGRQCANTPLHNLASPVRTGCPRRAYHGGGAHGHITRSAAPGGKRSRRSRLAVVRLAGGEAALGSPRAAGSEPSVLPVRGDWWRDKAPGPVTVIDGARVLSQTLQRCTGTALRVAGGRRTLSRWPAGPGLWSGRTRTQPAGAGERIGEVTRMTL
jgi:hypothetical protein